MLITDGAHIRTGFGPCNYEWKNRIGSVRNHQSDNVMNDAGGDFGFLRELTWDHIRYRPHRSGRLRAARLGGTLDRAPRRRECGLAPAAVDLAGGAHRPAADLDRRYRDRRAASDRADLRECRGARRDPGFGARLRDQGLRQLPDRGSSPRLSRTPTSRATGSRWTAVTARSRLSAPGWCTS